MTFDTTQPRHSDGTFGEKAGSPPDVTLAEPMSEVAAIRKRHDAALREEWYVTEGDIWVVDVVGDPMTGEAMQQQVLIAQTAPDTAEHIVTLHNDMRVLLAAFDQLQMTPAEYRLTGNEPF